MCIWITLGRWEDARYIENKIFMSVRKNVPNVLHTSNMPGTKGYRDRLWGGPVSPGQLLFWGPLSPLFRHSLPLQPWTHSCLLFNMTYSINQEVATSQWLFQLNSIYNRGFYASMGTKRRKFLTEIDFV